MRIKMVENGPCPVSGGVPIKEMMITPEGHYYTLREGRILPQAEKYALCRRGASRNAPFCDGSHLKTGFGGTETASREPFRERVVDIVSGQTMDLQDENRCAFARFCHTERGDGPPRGGDGKEREAAIYMAHACPTGRLVMVDRDGNSLEEVFELEIVIMQDPEKALAPTSV